MDAVVAAPYGLGQAQKDADHAQALAIEKDLFPKLCKLLQLQHGIDHGERYWRIVLGHWFRRYIDIILNRTLTLRQCISRYAVAGTTVIDSSDYRLATKDSYTAIIASDNDRWNQALYTAILARIPQVDFPVEVLRDGAVRTDFCVPNGEQYDFRSRLRRSLIWLANQLVPLLQRKDEVFILNSYMSRSEELKLRALLGQFPFRLGPTTRVPEVEVNLTLRRTLAEQIAGGAADSTEFMVRELLFELLPTCYLESFSQARETALKLHWPAYSRVVFTSNNFDTDELFKVWLAEKITQGTKYIVGQHGNNYGTYRYWNPSIEESTADFFVTWGWGGHASGYIPGFIFKVNGRSPLTWNPYGELLLIEMGLPHRIHTWDTDSEFDEYFEEQKKFVIGLSETSASKLRIRLYPNSRQLGWGEKERWAAFNSRLLVDDRSQPIKKLISRARLVVYSYDSTGMLETLSQNVPTIAFWQHGFEHLRESICPVYQTLLDVGIIHLTPESAAMHVNQIWDDVSAWWRSDAVQTARQTFCQVFARVSASPARDLKHILLSCKETTSSGAS